MRLRLENISAEPPCDLGVLRDESLIIGREAGLVLRLGSAAVSRSHGIFIPVANHWFYKDLGSTNGSWLNERRLAPDTFQIIRPGDLLQIADCLLQVDATEGEANIGPATSDIWSVAIMLGDNFVDEFPVPKYGRIMVIGGREADIVFPGGSEKGEDPALVCERRKDGIYAFQVDRSRQAFVNGQLLERSMLVNDNDCIAIEPFQIVINCPQPKVAEKEQEIVPAKTAPAPEFKTVAEAGIKEWGREEPAPPEEQMSEPRMQEPRSVVSPMFGKIAPRADRPEPDETVQTLTMTMPKSVNAGAFGGKESVRHERYRPKKQTVDSDEDSSSLLYRILIVVFAVLCLVLLGIVVSLFVA